VVKKRRRHVHGFQMPIDLVQLLAYVGYFFNLVIFYALAIFVLTGLKTARIVIGISYGVLILWVLVIKLIATRINPSDPLFKKTEKLLLQNLDYIPQPGELFCLRCESYADKTSKHWNACNRWVDGFDHHWRWLNNWVGRRNYKYFLILWLSLILLTVVNVIIYFVTIVRYFRYGDEVKEDLQSIYSKENMYVSLAFIFFTIIANIIILAATTKLMIFHFYLWRKSISTYEYIVKKRKLKAQIFHREEAKSVEKYGEWNGFDRKKSNSHTVRPDTKPEPGEYSNEDVVRNFDQDKSNERIVKWDLENEWEDE
jgi:hypothetical protein